jgi:hypothetical protein
MLARKMISLFLSLRWLSMLPLYMVLCPSWMGPQGTTKSKGMNKMRWIPHFVLGKGIFYYIVMLFGLKNAGATYQRAMTIVLDDLIYQSVECYIDDIVVKTRERQNHQDDLHVVFNRL